MNIPLLSFIYEEKEVKLSTSTYVFNFLCDECGHNINLANPESYLEEVQTGGVHKLFNFLADILYSSAKAKHKGGDFPYTRQDAHEWIPLYGTVGEIVELFTYQMQSNIVVKNPQTSTVAPKKPKP